MKTYIPHRGIYHPHKPGKICVVFDCFAKYQGKSLNDLMLSGPDLTNTLYGVLMRFRQERVTLMADIEATFHQVRVAPLKTIMIPRLELSAATISINQDKILRTELEALNDAQSIFWTDSTIVLRYIKNETNQYHTFIANHIAVIRHVHGDMNPADDASRGLTADNFLCQSSWLTGLEFLWKPKHEWPVQQKCLVVFRMKTLRSNRELRCACHWTSRIIPCQTTS